MIGGSGKDRSRWTGVRVSDVSQTQRRREAKLKGQHFCQLRFAIRIGSLRFFYAFVTVAVQFAGFSG